MEALKEFDTISVENPHTLNDADLMELGMVVLRGFKFGVPRTHCYPEFGPDHEPRIEHAVYRPRTGPPRPMSREQGISVLREISNRGSLPWNVCEIANQLLEEIDPPFGKTTAGRLLRDIDQALKQSKEVQEETSGAKEPPRKPPHQPPHPLVPPGGGSGSRKILRTNSEGVPEWGDLPKNVYVVNVGTIGWAIDRIYSGHRLGRKAWEYENKYLFLSKGTIYMIKDGHGGHTCTPCEDYISQEDLCADDWQEVEFSMEIPGAIVPVKKA